MKQRGCRLLHTSAGTSAEGTQMPVLATGDLQPAITPSCAACSNTAALMGRQPAEAEIWSFFLPFFPPLPTQQLSSGKAGTGGIGNTMHSLNHVEGWRWQLTTAALSKELAVLSRGKDVSLNCCSAIICTVYSGRSEICIYL